MGVSRENSHKINRLVFVCCEDKEDREGKKFFISYI